MAAESLALDIGVEDDRLGIGGSGISDKVDIVALLFKVGDAGQGFLLIAVINYCLDGTAVAEGSKEGAKGEGS